MLRTCSCVIALSAMVTCGLVTWQAETLTRFRIRPPAPSLAALFTVPRQTAQERPLRPEISSWRTVLSARSRRRPSCAPASPRHARPDIALEGDARLPADLTQIAGIAVDADVAGQLAGDATAAFERGAAVALCLDADAVERDGVEAAIGAPPHVALEIGLPHRADAAESPPQQRAYAPCEHVRAVERDGRERLTQRIVERGALPNPLDLRLERQPRHQRDRVAALDRSRKAASAEIIGHATDGVFGSLEIGPLQHRVDIPVRRTKMGPVAAVARGIEVEVTGGGAFEAIDRAMDSTGCTRLGDVEADMVAMAADALQPQQIGPGLEAGKSAIKVRPCPLRELLTRSLAEHPAPYTDPRIRIAAHEQLIALALVKRAERDQAERARDRRHDRLQGDLGVE